MGFRIRLYLLQNFLLESKEEDSRLKATDFGLSDYIKPGIYIYVTSMSVFICICIF